MWNAISCFNPSDWPERDGGERISGVFEAGVVSELLFLQHDTSRMALLGLVVDLVDLTCHIDVIGDRPLLVGFDSGMQCFSTRLKLSSKLRKV